MKNIWLLIGHSTAGKTKLILDLAQLESLKKFKFIDLDQEIEKKYGDISEIFNKQGEVEFRSFEKEVFNDLILDLENAVIAIGAGFDLGSLKENFNLVNLKVDFKSAARESIKLNRPITSGKTVKEIERLFEKRDVFFRSAKHQIDGEKFSALERVKYLEALLV